MLPEFFESRSHSKTPKVYMYYRNSIVKQFRDNPPRKITFTDVRRTLVGDVGSIRRVFDFLEAWGLINYSPSALTKPLKWDDKDAKSPADASLQSPPTIIKDTAKRICSGCKSICNIACFYCEKVSLFSLFLFSLILKSIVSKFSFFVLRCSPLHVCCLLASLIYLLYFRSILYAAAE